MSCSFPIVCYHINASYLLDGNLQDLTISKPFVVTGKSGLLRHKDLLRDSLEDAFDESAA
jgi:hypothetical protein